MHRFVDDQQSMADEADQARPARLSNNQTNANPLNRPSQLPGKQQGSSSNNNHPVQDDSSVSHETINTTQSDPNSSYAHSTGTTYVDELFEEKKILSSSFSGARNRTPNSTKSNAMLNPEADEFVPVFSVNDFPLSSVTFTRDDLLV